MTGRAALRATGVLHCNLNVRSMADSVGLYEELGLAVKMRTRPEGQDARPLGLGESTTCEAWFFYDRRGGRSAPALELVEWVDPSCEGEVYGHPSDVGIQSLGFDVGDVRALQDALIARGGRVRPGGPAGSGVVVLDVDGVALELTASPVEFTTMRYIRIVCADLTRTVKWWGQLGFDPVGTEESIAWEHAGESVEVRQQRVVLDGRPPFELRLTSWPHGSSLGMAHSRANHRGLFRIALAIDDVRSAVEAARALGGIDAGEATWGELPGMPHGMWASFFRDPDGVMVEYIELSR